MSHSSRELFRGWRATPAPPEIGARIVAAATSSAPVRGATAIERRRTLPPLRLAWLATAAALLILNLIARPPSSAPPATRPHPTIDPRVVPDPHLRSLLQQHSVRQPLLVAPGDTLRRLVYPRTSDATASNSQGDLP